MAMTAHVVYRGHRPCRAGHHIAESGRAKSCRGEIGFDGLLISDDTSMKALSGDFPDVAAAILAAGRRWSSFTATA